MRFTVGSDPEREIDRDTVQLDPTAWDDWFKFETQFDVTYRDAEGGFHRIGLVKIGELNLVGAGRSRPVEPGLRSPTLATSFDSLPNDQFSLGQDPSYYERLSDLGAEFRTSFLRAMNDLAFDPRRLDHVKAESVTRISLLREVPLVTVKTQFARLARGGQPLTKFQISYTLPSTRQRLYFRVDPASPLPTNIHVLIGRNGVGKSTLLNTIAKKVSKRLDADNNEDRLLKQISNLVSVSFSVFDEFDPLPVRQDRLHTAYHYVGLRKVGDSESLKTVSALSREIAASLRACLAGPRRERWLNAIELLSNDPIFGDAALAEVVNSYDVDEAVRAVLELFGKFSSGHKLVLLTITRLVETVSEKSLVLLDEPEAHLHPPLLSAFVRALSDLLTNRNGLAIVATHSPVILQEVPKDCVWILARSGHAQVAARPNIETYAENAGVLTSEVFGLELTSSGYNRMLRAAARKSSDYDEALRSIGGSLGMEGRAILRSAIASPDSENDDVAS